MGEGGGRIWFPFKVCGYLRVRHCRYSPEQYRAVGLAFIAIYYTTLLAKVAMTIICGLICENQPLPAFQQK